MGGLELISAEMIPLSAWPHFRSVNFVYGVSFVSLLFLWHLPCYIDVLSSSFWLQAELLFFLYFRKFNPFCPLRFLYKIYVNPKVSLLYFSVNPFHCDISRLLSLSYCPILGPCVFASDFQLYSLENVSLLEFKIYS